MVDVDDVMPLRLAAIVARLDDHVAGAIQTAAGTDKFIEFCLNFGFRIRVTAEDVLLVHEGC